MNHRSAPLFRVACAALLAIAANRAQSPSSDTAVGVFPFLVGNMDSQVTQVVQTIRQNDIDTIYVSVFRATGPRTGDLWITDAARTWNTAWGPVRPGGAGIDVVRLISEAHAAGLRVVGVLKCFDASVQPTDVSHRSYLLGVVDYLVSSFRPDGAPYYDFDGLALDYVRFVDGSTGNSPAPVTQFVRDVKQRLGGLSLHAYLLANRYSFDGPTYDGNFRSYTQTMDILKSDFGQDWEGLAPWLDVYMPMAYTADGSIYSSYALHQAYVRQCASYARTACSRAGYPSRRVQPVVKTYTSTGETTTDATVEASITGALLGGANGYQSFRYGTTQASWWAKLKQYAVPGPNFPTPVFTAPVIGLTADLDATQSRDNEEPGSALFVRYDWNDDGTYDTGWLPNVRTPRLLTAPGATRIGLRVRDAQGHESVTHRRVTGLDPFSQSAPSYPASRGGPHQIRIDVGPAGAGARFLVLGSLSGSSPGTLWQPGFLLPLNVDGVTDALLQIANTPFLQNALGRLDASGRATTVFDMPAGVLSPLVLRGISWAAIGVDAVGQPAFVTNAVLTVIVP